MNNGFDTFHAMLKETLTLNGMLLFSVYFIMAIIYRRKQSHHMRYMIATGLVLVPPALIRLLIFIFHVPPLTAEYSSLIFTDLLFAALIVYDMRNGRNYKPYLFSLLLFLAGNILFVLSKNLFIHGK